MATLTIPSRCGPGDETEARLGQIRDTLYRLQLGTLTVPEGADPKAFIVSGGNAIGKPQAAPRLTIGRLADDYLESLMGVEDNTRLTLKIHLNHVRRLLGDGTVLETIRLAEVERYANARVKERYRDEPIKSYTARKELRTFRRVWVATANRGRTSMPSWDLASIQLDKDPGREPFRTFKEINRILERGGVSAKEEQGYWETLYLDGGQLLELLDYAREHATAPWVYPMLVFVALTGCRRAEMVRSRFEDWYLDDGHVMIRERKRDKSKRFTLRKVDIHPLLLGVMKDWLGRHPGGQHTISADGGPITVDQATDHFNRTLADDPNWAKVPGFHTFRHSFASILASEGVDQPVIDGFMGHQTEEMRQRYRHLFRQTMTSAINRLLPGAAGGRG